MPPLYTKPGDLIKIKPGVRVRGYGDEPNSIPVCVLSPGTIVTVVKFITGGSGHPRHWIQVLTSSGICDIESINAVCIDEFESVEKSDSCQ